MSQDSSPEKVSELSRRMREEWNRRIAHDYRYWMSDGVESDEEMWQVGERDFQLIVSGLREERLESQTALEVGCGVGRLLRAASARFRRVVGVDVSEQAVAQARSLLSELKNVQIELGNGSDLSAVPTASVDFVYSFAALCSMPIKILSRYLIEISRVLKPDGIARLQVYLGRSQNIYEEDTLALRSFDETCFRRAVENAGYLFENKEELILPFEVSSPEIGVIAHIVTLRKVRTAAISSEEISSLLCPEGEFGAGAKWNGSEIEYLMALARAEQHLKNNNWQAAKTAVEFAINHYPGADTQTRAKLAELQRLSEVPVLVPSERGEQNLDIVISEQGEKQTVIVEAGDIFERNLKVLRSKFPQVASAISNVVPAEGFASKKNTQGLPVFSLEGVPLIHEEKPLRAAQIWAEQTLNNPRIGDAKDLLVAGFGAGYQLEALIQKTALPIHVFEPDARIIAGVLREKDCRALFDRLETFSLSIEGLQTNLGSRLTRGSCELVVLPQTKALHPESIDELRRRMVAARGLAQLRPRIAVVGPMYGGSLPIAKYTARALFGLGQRTFGYDLSKFYPSFKDIGGFISGQARRDSLENQYVELLSQSVLEGINEKPIDILICLAQAPMSPKVLTELRQRGVITVMWFVEDCSRFQTWKYLAPYFDYMFIIQKEPYIKQVLGAGAGRVIYLPVGCDPDIHRPVELSEEDRKRYGSDISFLGAGYNNRRHLFAHLANRNFKIWGTEWPDCTPFNKLVQEQGRRIEPEEYNKIFNASPVNLNLHSSAERDGVEPFGDFVNPRTFELAAAGAFQLVDERSLLGEQFVIGAEAAVFHDGGEMQDKIDYYLARPEERCAIISAARKRALGEHTYQHRLKTMLEYIYADCYERLKSRSQSGQWYSTMQAAKEFPELEASLKRIQDRGEEPQLDYLLAEIHNGKGTLSELEQKLLFLHHIRSQTTHIQNLRNEK